MSTKNSFSHGGSRRDFVRKTAAGLLAAGLPVPIEGLSATPRDAYTVQQGPDITFTPITAPSERPDPPPPNPEPPARKFGIAVVGIGRLAMGQVIPGIGQSKRTRLAALVSGDSAKARTVAAQHGIDAAHIYSYDTMDRLRDDPTVDAVYIAVPNLMHAEVAERAARAGKHVFSEKAMATTIGDAQRMVDAAANAKRQLMVGYRIQYEPHHLEVRRMVRQQTLGAIKVIEMVNVQDLGDPTQWRLHQKQCGGGSLWDMGIYCLNTARFLTGEEPVAMNAMFYRTPGDPRFADVPEENMTFQLRFPSGILVNAVSGFGLHRAQRYRVLAENGWVEMDPAFPYEGLRMRVARADEKAENIEERKLNTRHQFATELDHFAERARANQKPFTPGEEGLQDVKLMTMLTDAGREGKGVQLPAMTRPDAFRGDEPAS